MAVNTTPIFVDSYSSVITSLYDGHSTRPVVVATSGADGSRVHMMQASTNDGSDNSAKVHFIKETTLQSDMGVGALVDGGGSSDTITRTSGSFITDGWKVGDKVLVSGATTLANDFLVILTGVAALTLTFATSTVNTAENLPTGAKLYKAVQAEQVSVPTNAGNSTTVPAVNLLGGLIGVSSTIENSFLTLASDEGLAVAAGTALGSSEWMDIVVQKGDY